MTHSDAGNYKAKHSSDLMLDAKIAEAVGKRAVDGIITCADSSHIAGDLQVTMQEVGVTLDLMEIRLGKCQLGLFGYSTEKIAVKPALIIPGELEMAIRGALVNNRLPCAAAWNIAEKFNIPKMEVASVCEALKIKIKPCQLGAF